ncbi:ADP-ribosylation factor GTPase activating protein, ER-Golgi transport [Arachnomyces sp. PD_36]|nr:ADP-ribosylation factor GTPase activating protein, ER-Golgi transport [Arachnomyces sp. PD_36]
MTICPRLNCTSLEPVRDEFGYLQWNYPPFDPDPDISSFGVLIGFTGTGFITLILLVIQYVLGFAPDSDANPIDQGIIRWLWRKTSRRPSPLWGHALEKVARSILLMSDQQMITGIAILTSGYFELCDGNSFSGIISYDWQIVIYLAWFSSLTHLTTLTALRTYMIENPAIRLWRLLLMLLIVTMLIVALIPTMHEEWFYNDGSIVHLGSSRGAYAGCFYRSLSTSSFDVSINGLLSMVISLVVLLAGYASKTIKLFPKSSDWFRLTFRTAPGEWWKRRLDRIYRRSNQNLRKPFGINLKRIHYRTELAINQK